MKLSQKSQADGSYSKWWQSTGVTHEMLNILHILKKRILNAKDREFWLDGEKPMSSANPLVKYLGDQTH